MSNARGEFEDLEGFLSDRERDRGGFEGILKWKKNEPPVLDAWMSMRRNPIKIWRHNFPHIVSYEKEGVQESHAYTWRGGCWEDHAILENQNWRNKETGERETKFKDGKCIASPPRTCPQCLFIEWLRALVIDGKLGEGFAPFTWKEKGAERTEQANYSLVVPVFRLRGEDDENDTVITAGGFCNLFKEKNLDDADKRLLAKSGIQLTEGWKQNGSAGKNYLFTVADNNDVASGLHKAVESGQLGEAVIKVIADAIQGSPSNPDRGNPFKNPYCIRWKHLPKAPFPAPKYEALKLDKDEYPLTDEIKEVLQSDPPDVSEETSYLDKDELRTKMEAACVLKGVTIPWDEFFKHPSPDQAARSDSAKAPSPKPAAKEEKALPPKTESKKTEEKPAPTKDPKNPLGLDPEGDETCECECPVSEGAEEQCGGLMRVSDDTCPVCGAVYDLKADPVALVKRPWDKPKAESPKQRGRAQAGAPKEEPEKGKGGAVPGKDKLAW